MPSFDPQSTFTTAKCVTVYRLLKPTVSDSSCDSTKVKSNIDQWTLKTVRTLAHAALVACVMKTTALRVIRSKVPKINTPRRTLRKVRRHRQVPHHNNNRYYQRTNSNHQPWTPCSPI